MRVGPSRQTRRQRAAIWLAVVAWAALIFVLSSIPGLGTGLGVWDLVLRKIGHAAEFGVLALLLLGALERELPAFVVALAYAASDELHQHFVGGRHASVVDVGIDAVGIAAALVAARVWQVRLAR